MYQTIKIGVVTFALHAIVLAGVGGKLAGRVTSEDGEPLVGVNIVIEGTEMGTASGETGEYFILNIPPGRYTIIFMIIGYKTSIQKDVAIMSDFTTRLNVSQEQIVLEAGEEVVVVATRPLIQRDATSKVTVVDADEIINMPVVDFKDVLVTQAGFTTDASGGIHVRGGRTKEILYMIDGIVVKDPLRGDFTGSVNQNAIQEMTIISGTFNAEYGQAMSSVVNIVTKEGGDRFHGKFEHITDQLNESPYHSPGAFKDVADSNYSWKSLKGDTYDYLQQNLKTSSTKPLLPLANLPVRGSLSLNMGGKLPVIGINYFVSGYYSSNDSWFPHGLDVNQDVQLKLTGRVTPKVKLATHIHSSNRLYQNYSHTWKYRPEHQAHTFKSNDRLALILTHSVSEPLFYTFSLSRQDVATREGVMDKSPAEYKRSLTDESVYFYGSGDQGIYTDNRSISNATQLDVTYQLNNRHLLKSGFSYTSYNLDIYTEEEPWVGGTNFKDDTTFSPVENSFYIQDKIEYDFLILNIGLRYDRVDANATMWKDINRFVEWDSTKDVWIPAPLVAVPARSKWSPRIGIAYPVTDRTVFHFSYGHFFQTPTFDAMTYNALKDISTTLPLVGNPDVKPQKTVAFETGLKQALSNDVALELTVWSKDIRDLLSTLQIRYLSTQYVVYTNTDYASVKGIDISVRKRFSRSFGGSLNYSLSVTKGNNSSPIGGYFSAYTQEEVPHQQFFLNFDQRHDIAVNLDIRTTENAGMRLMGIRPFANINANLLINAGSGLPYTPYVDPTVRVDINSARKPWTFSADLRVRKRILLQSISLTAFLEVTNLTDYRNVFYVYSRTGKPFDPGFSGVGTSEDANHNPAHLGRGRTIKAGLSLEW